MKKYVVIGLLFVLSACAAQPTQVDTISAPAKPVDTFNKWLNSEIERDKVFQLKQRFSQ